MPTPFPQLVSWRTHPLVFAIACINLVVFLGVTLLPNPGTCFGGLSAYGVIVEGEYWRIVSSMFMHYSFSHFIFNTIALLIFGAYAESFWGWRKTLFIYLFCGIFANIIALIFAYLTNSVAYCAIGASAAILGIMAATACLMWTLWRKNKNPFAHRFAIQLTIIFALQFILDAFIPSTSSLHHITGAIAGFCVAWIILRRSFRHT